MEIKEIEKLAELSQLKFTKEEMIQFSKDFENMIELANVTKYSDINEKIKISTMKLEDLREDK